MFRKDEIVKANFDRPWYAKIFTHIRYNIFILYKNWKYPENVWYGGGLKRETALRSVGEGWSKIINNLYDAKPKHVRVTEVKEKYSYLHFYVSSAPEWYWDLISYYETLSSKICEICGKPGETRNRSGWLLTLCDDCDTINKSDNSFTGDSDHEHDDKIL